MTWNIEEGIQPTGTVTVGADGVVRGDGTNFKNELEIGMYFSTANGESVIKRITSGKRLELKDGFESPKDSQFYVADKPLHDTPPVPATEDDNGTNDVDNTLFDNADTDNTPIETPTDETIVENSNTDTIEEDIPEQDTTDVIDNEKASEDSPVEGEEVPVTQDITDETSTTDITEDTTSEATEDGGMVDEISDESTISEITEEVHETPDIDETPDADNDTVDGDSEADGDAAHCGTIKVTKGVGRRAHRVFKEVMVASRHTIEEIE